MERQEYAHITILNEEFSKAKGTNPRISLRSFAKKLNIHPATLSSILKGRRGIPKSKLPELLDRMDLTKTRKNQFIRSIEAFGVIKSDLHNLLEEGGYTLDNQNELHCKIIREWEYYAIITLLEVNGDWSQEKIADHFGFSVEKTNLLLQDLVAAKLVAQEGRFYSLAIKQAVQTTHDIPSRTIKEAHKNELGLCFEKILSMPTDQSDFSSNTMAIDRKNLPKAKALIKRFCHELSDLLESGDKQDVYLLGIQLMPLTKLPLKELE